MKPIYVKLAAIALLALMALAPIISLTRGVQYPAGEWRVAFLTQGNKPVPKGIGTVFLYNTTNGVANKVELSYAVIGENGIATFIDLPGDIWAGGFGSSNIIYSIMVNFTLADGTVTNILLLPLTQVVILPATFGTPIIFKDADGEYGLGALLNDTTGAHGGLPIGSSWYYNFEWFDAGSAGYTKILNFERPGYLLYLAPIAFRVVDEAGFGLVGAGVEMIAKAWTDEARTTWVQYSLDAQVANGTWGSEFVGNMPVATVNDRVGWVEFLAPCYFAQGIGDTGLANLTWIVRYKTNDPRVGPIVGRFQTDYMDIYHPSLTTGFELPPGPPAAETVPTHWYFSTMDIYAYYGTRFYSLESCYAYSFVWCDVRWTYSLLTDFYNNAWYTKDAEKWLKWAEGPVGSYMFGGVNVAPGLILLRFPDRLWNTVPLLGDLGYHFNLTAGVEWHYSVVNHPVIPFNPDTLLDGYWGYRPWYGATPGSGGGSSFLHFALDQGGIGMEVEWCEMYRTEIKLDSSAEVPQALRNDIALTIILPAGVAANQNATIAWSTSNTGYVILPDTEATRLNADPYGLWGVIADYTMGDYAYYYYPDNVYGWLPSIALGHTNFIGWYQGVKVLDTTVSGGYPAGNLPPVYMGGDWYWNPQYTYIDWSPNAASDPTDVVTYKLAIYELGFVLKFTPAPNGDTRPVPWYTPFFFTLPTGRLVGPTVTQPALIPQPDIETYGIYELVKALPGGSYSNFFIVWKGAMIQAINTTTGAVLGPINLTGNLPNIELVFPVYDLNVTVFSQDPFKIVGVDVRLNSTTDFSKFGLPYYVIREITDWHTMFSWASLPWGANYFRDSTGDSINFGGLGTTDGTGFQVTTATAVGTSIKWAYWTEFETTGANAPGQVLPAMFTKLPKKVYDIWVRVPGNDGREGALMAMEAGFRSTDMNKTLYWSKDPYPNVGPLNLTGHTNLDLNSYVYNPNVAIKDAGGAALPLLNGTSSAIFLVEPWYNGSASVYEDFWYDKVAKIWNPYFLRTNSTDANGKHTFHSVNATKASPPTDPDLLNVAKITDFVTGPSFMGGMSRFLIGKSTFQSADSYRFMVYYEGVLVYNESVPLQNPYVSKDHNIVTSVYPYIFKVTNTPLPDEKWRFGIQNLNTTVFWAGLNTSWWPSFSLVTDTAVREFSLLNASKLTKGFNMTVLERLWHWAPKAPITLVEIPYTPVPPYFSAALFTKNGKSDANGEFKALIPVWNYSYSGDFYTYMEDEDASLWGTRVAGGPRDPWVKSAGPLGINLKPARYEFHGWSGFFGTPIYANWTTIPGVTNNISAKENPRLAATLESASDALNQSWPNGWWYIEAGVNATGLVNTQSYYSDPTWSKSLNTTSRAPAEPWGGVGMLSGGVFQGRQAVDVFESTVVGPPQPYANFYAKLQVTAPANDLGIIVTDLWGNDLPNQYVEVWDTTNKVLMFHNYTPLIPTAKKDWYPDGLASQLFVRSTPTNILWGFYDFDVYTTNCTQYPAHNLATDWQLDPQWLHAQLEGGAVDWMSDWLILAWPTKLQVTVYAGDGTRYLHNAWVFIVDGVSGDNVTAALTDTSGYAGSLDTTAQKLLWQMDSLATSDTTGEGMKVNLGFNLWGWDVKGGEQPLVHNFDGHMIYENAVGKHVGDITTIYDQYPQPGTGKWIVKVFWKAPGPAGISEVLPYGKVVGVSVWDTFRDQPQHRYIYLGVQPPDTATGEDWARAQVRTFNTKVWDMKLTATDQSPSSRLVNGTKLTITGNGMTLHATTNTTGAAAFSLLPAGSYNVVAEYPTSLYGKDPKTFLGTGVINVADGTATGLVQFPIYDATITMVTPSGKPIVGADVTVGPTALGKTDANGNIVATDIPVGSYTVTSKWFGQDISPAVPLTVTLSRTYLLTATHIAVVQIQVVGAQNQGLAQASVTIKSGTSTGATVFAGMANNDGVVTEELPFGDYYVTASSKGVEASTTLHVTGDTVAKISTGVFIELFGQGLTFAGFALWVIAILIVVLILIIAAQEYNIYRRKRLPQLFGAGPTR